MPNGGALKLSVSCRQPDESSPGDLFIRVEDQGVGIAPEELDGIFQPFRGGFERGTGSAWPSFTVSSATTAARCT
jgi:signal transduction histidine kinase